MNPSHPGSTSSHVPAGIAFMIVGGLMNVLMISIAKSISDDIHPIQIGFFRCLFGFLALIPFICRRGTAPPWKTRRLPLHALRAFLNAVAMICFFWAASLAPLATVSALNFTAPLFATMLAIFLLGERVRAHGWLTLAVGFAGAVVILRPDSAGIELGALIALGSAAAWAMALIAVKKLTSTESSITITFWASSLMAAFAAPPAIAVWVTPAMDQWFWLAMIGCVGTVMQVCVAKAFSMADATVLLPFDFAKLIWATLVGFLLFSERPDVYTLVGGAIIIVCSLYSARRTRTPISTG